jgi:hypothetical protein
LDDIAVHLKRGAIIVPIDTEAPSLEEFKVAAEKLWSGRSKEKCVIKSFNGKENPAVVGNSYNMLINGS